jgi:N6-L-threonylcarbamoyladenine synthase
VGEAYDKVARVIGLGYPGGPKVDALAKQGDPHAIEFKRVYLEKDSLDFSFSGTKTAVINYMHSAQQRGEVVKPADVAASFQQAVIEVLVNKAVRAVKEAGYCELALAGGVACNSELRRQLGEALAKDGIGLYVPSPILCTDNGAMVAAAAYRKARKGHYASGRLDVFPNLNIETQLDLLDR